jgi:hypothetical protein
MRFGLFTGMALFLLANVAHAQTFKLCEGEYIEPHKGNQCQAYDVYAYCGDADNQAARVCKGLGGSGAHSMVKVRDIGGNKCGYANYMVVCK